MTNSILAELDAGKTALKPLYCPALQKRRKSSMVILPKMEKDEIGIAKRVDLRIQNPVVPGWTVQLSETELSNPHRPRKTDPGQNPRFPPLGVCQHLPITSEAAFGLYSGADVIKHLPVAAIHVTSIAPIFRDFFSKYRTLQSWNALYSSIQRGL